MIRRLFAKMRNASSDRAIEVVDDATFLAAREKAGAKAFAYAYDNNCRVESMIVSPERGFVYTFSKAQRNETTRKIERVKWEVAYTA